MNHNNDIQNNASVGVRRPVTMALAIASGTVAYADPVRFDNDGTFVWSDGVYLDLTKPPEEQTGSPGDRPTFEYRRTDYQRMNVVGSRPGTHIVHYALNTVIVAGRLGDVVPDDFLVPGNEWDIGGSLGYYYSSGFYTQFDKSQPQDPGYIAARFDIGGATHYGWMSVVLGVDSGPPARLVFDLLAWGYETEPNTPIEAGAVPAPSGALALLAFGAAAGATRARRA